MLRYVAAAAYHLPASPIQAARRAGHPAKAAQRTCVAIGNPKSLERTAIARERSRSGPGGAVEAERRALACSGPSRDSGAPREGSNAVAIDDGCTAGRGKSMQPSTAERGEARLERALCVPPCVPTVGLNSAEHVARPPRAAGAPQPAHPRRQRSRGAWRACTTLLQFPHTCQSRNGSPAGL